MNGARLTAAAERAGQRYRLLLAGFTSIFSQSLNHPKPGSALVKSRAAKQAYTMAEIYLDHERIHIEQVMAEITRDGFVETLKDLRLPLVADMPQSISEHVVGLAEDLENSLRVQLERDIAAVTRGMRNVALRASLTGKAQGVSERQALLRLRQQSDTSPLYQFQDRAGRRWPSERAVRTFWRHALVLGWNETALMTMVEYGQNLAQVAHPDASHSDIGTLIALDEQTATETVTWPQIAESVFHPNSNAWVEPLSER